MSCTPTTRVRRSSIHNMQNINTLEYELVYYYPRVVYESYDNTSIFTTRTLVLCIILLSRILASMHA